MFYVRTNKDAKNYRIVTTPDSDPDPKNWKPFIEHRPDVLVQGVDLFKEFGVVVEKHEALNRLRVHNFKTGEWHTIPFPEPVYSVFPDANPEYDTSVFPFNYQSLITPASVFDYDLKTRKQVLSMETEVLGGYDPTQYVSERLWATARDGVRVPLSIVYRKGFKRDGTAPLFLYA